MKIIRLLCPVLALLLLFGLTPVLAVSEVESAEAAVETKKEESGLPCKSAILMDAATGTVLYEQNADEALPPASVTKIMTLLLVMEAMDEGKFTWSDTVTTSAHAAAMGGSQVYLKEGETMTVEDMVKSVVIASANDCAVALAEYTAGSEEAFVARMNERAASLGMVNTHFENTNGLDDTATHHVTSARDIALMSRALIRYEKILQYSSTWMDSIRDGAFGLTNTNRLVRFYPGCNGLKTGSTSRAGFCVSATATRGDLSLICVIMGAESRDVRNRTATKLLDMGFADYSAYSHAGDSVTLPTEGATVPAATVRYASFGAVVPKGSAGRVLAKAEMPEKLTAPLTAGQQVGDLVFTLDGKEIGRVPILVCEDVPKIGFFTLFCRMLAQMFLT